MLQVAIGHHEAGRLAEADAAYRDVIRADPHNADALHFLGYVHFQRGEYREAIDLIARSLAVYPANPRALYNLGIARLAVGEREQAAEAFRETVRLQPQLAEAHFYLGNMLCDDDRIEEGLACMRRALEARPEYPEARWTLALAPSSESEEGAIGSDDALRNPKTDRTVRTDSMNIDSSTVPRAHELPLLRLPDRFRRLRREQQVGAIAALKQVESGLQQAVLDEWAARCEASAVRNPAGYLFGIIQKALRGEFHAWASERR